MTESQTYKTIEKILVDDEYYINEEIDHLEEWFPWFTKELDRARVLDKYIKGLLTRFKDSLGMEPLSHSSLKVSVAQDSKESSCSKERGSKEKQ